jgi:hypothetical protein
MIDYVDTPTEKVTEMLEDYFGGMIADLIGDVYGNFTDERMPASKGWEELSWASNSTRSIQADAFTVVEMDFENLDYAAWEECMNLEPAWTDSEDMWDNIECDAYDAEMLSDAATAWAAIHYNK